MLLKDDLNCVLECEKSIASSSRVRIGVQLLEVELQRSLGEAIGELRDLLEVLLVAVTGGSLLLLAILALYLLLLLAFSFRLACLPC